MLRRLQKLSNLDLQRIYRRKNCLGRQVELISRMLRIGVEQRPLLQGNYPYKKVQRIKNSPRYVVTVRVKSLKPFNTTELYKKILEAQGLTDAEKNTYNLNSKNGYMNS